MNPSQPENLSTCSQKDPSRKWGFLRFLLSRHGLLLVLAVLVLLFLIFFKMTGGWGRGGNGEGPSLTAPTFNTFDVIVRKSGYFLATSPVSAFEAAKKAKADGRPVTVYFERDATTMQEDEITTALRDQNVKFSRVYATWP